MTENARSVIEIDVNSDAWKEFEAAFSGFTAAIGTTEKKVSDVGAAAGKAGSASKGAFDKVRAALADISKIGRDSIFVFQRMASIAYDIAKSFASAAFSAAKWLAFGAIASGFGLGALGSGASSARREAAGAGVSPGQYKAADIYFRQILGDSAGVLGNIARTMNDPASRIAFTSLGINPAGKQPFQLMNEFLVAASAAARKNPNIPLAAFDATLGKILSIEQYKALGQAGPGEVGGLARSAERTAPGLSPSDATLKGWQHFMIALDLAGTRIENSLIGALVKLAAPLGKFANQVASAIDAFSKSGGFQHVLDVVIAGVKEFGTYITSAKFGADIDKFGKALGDIADVMVQTAGVIRKAMGLPEKVWGAVTSKLADDSAVIGGIASDVTSAFTGRTSAGERIGAQTLQDYETAASLRARLSASKRAPIDFMASQGMARVGTDAGPGTSVSTLFASPMINLYVISPPYLDFTASMAQGAGQ